MTDSLFKKWRAYEKLVENDYMGHARFFQPRSVLRECRRVLSPNGLVVVIDVFRREGESREAYLHRWEGNARAAFTDLDEEEMTTLIDHVWSCDFPESLSTYEELGTRAGYDRVVSLAEDDLNRLVVLET